ncbi:TonB-dependent receptor [Sphingobium sp. Sx8-8]|uniref:TonB-dependent receptor n=1 Tax=Sphingobium sp. Sx8-8 TaxID=2933617 RepID=UPI001F5727A2|nr:TonB-dependent receptor [Sphingobium sp. Sx8-8]
MSFDRTRFLSSCAAIMTCLATPALAQSEAPQESQANQDFGSTSDIIVTARRVSESLQNVPVAITAFSQDMLNERAVSSAFDLSKSVPGLVTSADSGNGALPSFAIRGRGQFFGAATGSVETYFADVPLSPPFQMPTLPPQYFDLASVQVLKGPQGTLFGRNTTGGAVLFVPQTPSDKFEGYVRGQLGTYDNAQLEAALNLPLGDIGALRLAGFAWHRKGYVETVAGRVDSAASFTNGATFNFLTGQFSGPGTVLLPRTDIYNQDVLEFRGTLRLNLSDSIENTTILTWHGDRNRASSQLHQLRTGTQLAGAIGAYFPTLLPDNPRIADVDTDLTRPRSSTWAAINTTTWEATDNLRLKNIVSYISAEGYGNNPADVDGSPFPAINLVRPGRPLKNRQFYEELQLQGNVGPVEYIVGGNIDNTRQPGANDKINVPTLTFDTGGFDHQYRQSRYSSKSLFSSFTFKANDQLSFTAAARHTWDDISDRSVLVNNAPRFLAVAPLDASGENCVASLLPTGATCQVLNGSRKFKGWSYNGGVDYKVTDDVLLYGGYRHGYKRGGFNGRGGTLADFGPENVDDFYAGMKAAFLIGGRRSTFNIEGFWDNYKGAQRSYLDLSGGALVTTIQNAGKTRYRGFDTDMVLNLTDWFRLSGNYTFVDAKYLKFQDVSVAAANAIAPFILTPSQLAAYRALNLQVDNNYMAGNIPGQNSRHKLNIQGRFHHTLNDGAEIAFIPSMTYQSKFYLNDSSFVLPAIGAVLFNGGVPLNSVAQGANIAPGYTTFDMRLEFNNIADRFDLSLNATNVTNKLYRVGGTGIWQFGVDSVAYGPPRMYFVEARYRF